MPPSSQARGKQGRLSTGPDKVIRNFQQRALVSTCLFLRTGRDSSLRAMVWVPLVSRSEGKTACCPGLASTPCAQSMPVCSITPEVQHLLCFSSHLPTWLQIPGCACLPLGRPQGDTGEPQGFRVTGKGVSRGWTGELGWTRWPSLALDQAGCGAVLGGPTGLGLIPKVARAGEY